MVDSSLKKNKYAIVFGKKIKRDILQKKDPMTFIKLAHEYDHKKKTNEDQWSWDFVDKRWTMRSNTASAVFAIICIGAVYTDIKFTTHSQSKNNCPYNLAIKNLENLNIDEDPDNYPLNNIVMSHEALIGQDFETIAKIILCPYLQKYIAARKIQRTFREYMSRQRIKNRNAIIFKELMEVVWKPSRITIEMLDS
jgi:hypothetical protein